jgi:hypothetical protein
MKRNFLRYKTGWIGLLAALLFATLVLTKEACAQQQGAALVTGMAANAQQLRQYTFKQRTEMYHKGELKNAKLEEIHYSASGERVSIPIDEQRTQSDTPRRGPGHRIITKKMAEQKEEIKDYMDRLMSLASRYLTSDPAKLQAALANAEMTTGGGSTQVRFRMRDYVKAGDTMTMSFDSATKRPTRTEVNTLLDGAPVAIVLAFDQIREGPSYPVRTVVKSDERQLEIRLLTYDYRL